MNFNRLAEVMNGTLFLNLSFAIMMFTVYAVRFGYRRQRAQAAIAISVVLLGECVLRGLFWLLRFQTGNGWDTSWINSWPIAQVGQAIEMAGVLCIIRVFTPDGWSPRTWLLIGLTSAVISTAISVLLSRLH